jgi:anionic cell wall polymer biosynthesis LytR-Cps2A-Psr (LCP) family protein
VQIPGHGNNKLNVAYTIGGMKLLNQTLEENFGVQIDGNITVNFGSFIKLIDMAGGVEIELSAAEANYLNKNGNWGVTSNNGWNLKEGKNTTFRRDNTAVCNLPVLLFPGLKPHSEVQPRSYLL